MTDFDMPAGLALCCQICRWRPPGDLTMDFFQVHFDLEPDHDPENIKLELVAVCDRDGLEMTLGRSETTGTGRIKRHYQCPGCHRSRAVWQEATR
jgi:hypothetical protein